MTRDVFIGLTIFVLVFALATWFFEKRQPAHTIKWLPTHGMTTTISNRMYRFEFGFREDGVVLWRVGEPL